MSLQVTLHLFETIIPLESPQLHCFFWYGNLKHHKTNGNISVAGPRV